MVGLLQVGSHAVNASEGISGDVAGQLWRFKKLNTASGAVRLADLTEITMMDARQHAPRTPRTTPDHHTYPPGSAKEKKEGLGVSSVLPSSATTTVAVTSLGAVMGAGHVLDALLSRRKTLSN